MSQTKNTPNQIPAISDAIDNAIGKPCTLCGCTSNCAGVFIPGDSQSWGAMPNKRRFIIYPICKLCLSQQDASIKVEAVMALDMGLVSVQ